MPKCTQHTPGRINIAINRFRWLLHFLLKNSRTILLSFPVRRRALQNYTDLPPSVYRDHCKITFVAREHNYNSALLQHTTRERDGWLWWGTTHTQKIINSAVCVICPAMRRVVLLYRVLTTVIMIIHQREVRCSIFYKHSLRSGNEISRPWNQTLKLQKNPMKTCVPILCQVFQHKMLKKTLRHLFKWTGLWQKMKPEIKDKSYRLPKKNRSTW